MEKPKWHKEDKRALRLLLETNSLRPLPRELFAQNTTEVAQLVLGKVLVRPSRHGLIAAKIVETEAYTGEYDPAAHARFGRTNRTRALYGAPGHAYIFSIHGHFCLNFVAEPIESPGCVLIRAVEPLSGIHIMRELRDWKDGQQYVNLTYGPGKLC
jgi:DNA-3-methyladenine glycosylase